MVIVAGSDGLRLQRLTLGFYGTNSYLLSCAHAGQAVVIDAPGEAATVVDALGALQARCLLITHAHMDHVGALGELKARLGIPVAVHAADAGRLPVAADMLLHDNDRISFGLQELVVIHTPGHTPGSVCFLAGGHLIAGDTLFPGGPGHTDTPAAFRQILDSLERRLFMLPENTLVHPGHGESTTLGRERAAFRRFLARHRDPHLCGDVCWEQA